MSDATNTNTCTHKDTNSLTLIVGPKLSVRPTINVPTINVREFVFLCVHVFVVEECGSHN